MIAERKQSINYNLILISVIGLLLIYPLFRKGLFFDIYWLPYQMAVGFCALLIVLFKKSNKDKLSIEGLDLTGLMLVLAYVISVFAAVDVHGAINELFKVVSYILIFFMIAYSFDSIKDITTLLTVYYWGGIGVVFISLGAAFGTFAYQGAFVGGRLYSTLQYPNTFAVLSLVIFIIGLCLSEKTKHLPLKIVYTFTNYLCLVGFFGAASRGAFLTLITVFLVYFIAFPGSGRYTLIFKTSLYLITSYLFVNIVFIQLPKHTPLYYWGLLAAFSLPVFSPVIIQKLSPDEGKLNRKLKLVCLAGLIIIIVGAFVSIQGGLLGNRLAAIGSYTGGGFTERVVIYQDAIKIVKDYPVFGAGGRGWEALYRQYQGYNYLSSEIHNHYLQVWVETGIIGLIVFIGIWAVAIYTAFNSIRKVDDADYRILTWSVFCAALVLGIHSFADFNLSIPAIAILLWVLFGCLRALQRYSDSGKKKLHFQLNGRLFKKITVLLTGLFFILSVLFVISLNNGDDGLAKMQIRAYTPAKKQLETAVKINPFSSTYTAALAEDLMFLGDANNEPKDLDKALKYINKAVGLEPFNPNYRLVKGKILLLLDKVEQGVLEFEQANKLAPWDQKYADRLAETYFLTGQYFYAKGDKTKAKVYYKKAAEYPDLVQKQIENIQTKYKKLQVASRALTVSNQMNSIKKMSLEILEKL